MDPVCLSCSPNSVLRKDENVELSVSSLYSCWEGAVVKWISPCVRISAPVVVGRKEVEYSAPAVEEDAWKVLDCFCCDSEW